MYRADSLSSMIKPMSTSNIKPLRVFLLMLAAFPVAGLVCAITYADRSMFLWSLAAVPIAAVVFPVAFFSMRMIPVLLLGAVGSIFVGVAKLFSRKR